MLHRFDTAHDPDRSLPGHRHQPAYVALVEHGSYQEDSVDGRYHCQAGMAIVHPPLHLHANQFRHGPAHVTNVNLEAAPGYQVRRLSDRRFRQAKRARDGEQLLEIIESEGDLIAPERPPPMVQTMAEALTEDPRIRIDALARSLNLSPEHAARQFKRHTGMTPVQFRSERRLRQALGDLADGISAIDVAQQRGYSDQSHLCRTIKSAACVTIGDLAGSDLFKT